MRRDSVQMSRRPWPVWLVVLFLALTVWRTLSRRPELPDRLPPAMEPTRVVRVVDGDTLLLEDGVRVRLLGVDTPETKRPNHPVEPLGPEASAFTRSFIGSQPIRLEYDRERRDRFGRVLAYVYVGDQLLNEELIRAGFSRAETRFSFSQTMKRRFRDAEEFARTEVNGIWRLEVTP
ncbi:thermonuclease family protein [Thalassoroseus pseudoceratinae]|uniref:thermonuclease family protein n=1 Tax=Thalassoroseus pseudoceratinae TaxID=2713176 RepID=UPI00141D8269|nr:thermonuclease family protein [Thalassoroseus pseudoceratinae]